MLISTLIEVKAEVYVELGNRCTLIAMVTTFSVYRVAVGGCVLKVRMRLFQFGVVVVVVETYLSVQLNKPRPTDTGWRSLDLSEELRGSDVQWAASEERDSENITERLSFSRDLLPLWHVLEIRGGSRVSQIL